MVTRSDAGQLNVSWAMCPKWATRQSAESVQLVEGLGGLISLSMIDVQGSGSTGGRKLALELQAFLRHLLASGVSPATAATATNEHLVSLRAGRVGAAIHIASVSDDRQNLSVVGFGQLAIAHETDGNWSGRELTADLAGFSVESRWTSLEISIPSIDHVVLANDGVATHGEQLADIVGSIHGEPGQHISANAVLTASNQLDGNRSRSDKSVAVFSRTLDGNLDRRNTGEASYPSSYVSGDS